MNIILSVIFYNFFFVFFSHEDFMALEIQNGYPRLLVDYGSGTVQANHTEIKLTDGALHHIDIIWTNVVSFHFNLFISANRY